MARSPDDTNARQVMALVHKDRDQIKEATAILTQGLKPAQNAPGAWNLLISLHFNAGEFQQAADCLARAGVIVDQQAVLCRMACLVHSSLGDFQKATPYLETLPTLAGSTPDMAQECLKALCSPLNAGKPFALVPPLLARWPGHEDLQWAAVLAAGHDREHRAALDLLAPFVAMKRPEALLNQALSFLELGLPEQAEQAARVGLELEPNSVALMVSFGRALRLQEKYEEALEQLDRAVALDPKHVNTYIELGNMYTRWGQRDKALYWLEKGNELCDHPGVKNNLSLELLSRGEMQRGFELYEERLNPELALAVSPPVALPTWSGEDLTRKSLVIWGEQALGEQLLHFQAIEPLLARADVSASQVTVICDRRLIPIFQRAQPGLSFIEKQQVLDLSETDPDAAAALVQGDFTIAMGSLHLRLGVDVVKDYGNAPYLSCDATLHQGLRAKYEALAQGRPIVGVAWGSVNPNWGTEKTILPEVFGATLAGTGCFFVNLQYAPTEEGLNRARQALTPSEELYVDEDVDSISGLESFFAQVAACDLIATISNSTAHVAGAQGIAADVLVPRGRGALWYWFQSDEVPGWYSSVVTHRQKVAGEWAETLAELKGRLLDLSAGSGVPDIAVSVRREADLKAAVAKHAEGDLLSAWALCAPHASIQSTSIEVLRLAGILKVKLGEIDLGLTYLLRAAALSAQDADVRLFLARGYYEKHNLVSADTELSLAEEAGCDRALSNSLRADIRFAQGEPSEGIAHLRQVVSASPHPGARLNLALALLRNRQFEEGFDLYEHRQDEEIGSGAQTPASMTEWDGSPLEGRALLLRGEQGLGDMILHAQAIDAILERSDVAAEHVSLACDVRLHDAFARRWPDLNLISPQLLEDEGAMAGELADVTLPVPSLHRLLGPTAWNSYGQRAALQPPQSTTETLRQNYQQRAEGRPIIGVSWASPSGLDGAAKSIPAMSFAEPFWDRPVWCLHLNQKVPSDDDSRVLQSAFKDVPLFVDEDINPERDFDAHLAQIAACDMIVTVSNTVAHAAGAMGKPVLLLLPKHKGRHWYWLDEPEKGMWYPNVVPLVQRKSGNWSWPLFAAKSYLAQQFQ